MAGNNNEPRYAPYPAEIKGAAMVRNFDVLTYQEQLLSDVQRSLRVLSQTYTKLIERYIKLGGTVSPGEHTNGDPNQGEWWFSLGSTMLCIQLGRNMMPQTAIHYMDLTQTPMTEGLEIGEICKTIEAIIYREAPDKAALELGLCSTNLRNGEMVNGIQDVANRIKADTLLLTQALSGASIEHITNDEIYKAAAAAMNTEDRAQ